MTPLKYINEAPILKVSNQHMNPRTVIFSFVLLDDLAIINLRTQGNYKQHEEHSHPVNPALPPILTVSPKLSTNLACGQYQT